MNRLTRVIELAKTRGDKLLVAYLTGGVPDIKGTLEYFKAIEKGGADIIEIGIPFSDALADGPVNQAAALSAIEKGIGISDIFDLAKNIRSFSEIPVVFLVYYNTVFHYGTKEFAAECKNCGVDGLVIPDLPMEERSELQKYTDKKDLCLIPLVAPTSINRVKRITTGMNGFTYCVSSMGVTGERKVFRQETKKYIEEVCARSTLPVIVGFGISDSDTAGFFYNIADGIIVGSAIVRRIMEGQSPKAISEFVSSLIYAE